MIISRGPTATYSVSTRISIPLHSSRPLLPASRIAVVAIVFLNVGNAFLSNSSGLTILSFNAVTASTNVSDRLMRNEPEHCARGPEKKGTSLKNLRIAGNLVPDAPTLTGAPESAFLFLDWI